MFGPSWSTSWWEVYIYQINYCSCCSRLDFLSTLHWHRYYLSYNIQLLSLLPEILNFFVFYLHDFFFVFVYIITYWKCWGGLSEVWAIGLVRTTFLHMVWVHHISDVLCYSPCGVCIFHHLKHHKECGNTLFHLYKAISNFHLLEIYGIIKKSKCMCVCISSQSFCSLWPVVFLRLFSFPLIRIIPCFW